VPSANSPPVNRYEHLFSSSGEGATAPGESQSFEFTVFCWTEFKKTLIASFGWKLDYEE
jgi:hypothetical protein